MRRYAKPQRTGRRQRRYMTRQERQTSARRDSFNQFRGGAGF